MPMWLTVLIHALASAVAVLVILLAFWRLVVRPYLNEKVKELVKATNDIEPKVTRGVKAGVSETLRELPEVALDGTVRESTRQFLRFGSGLFENGLSAFLGSATDLDKHNQSGGGQTPRD